MWSVCIATARVTPDIANTSKLFSEQVLFSDGAVAGYAQLYHHLTGKRPDINHRARSGFASTARELGAIQTGTQYVTGSIVPGCSC